MNRRILMIYFLGACGVAMALARLQAAEPHDGEPRALPADLVTLADLVRYGAPRNPRVAAAQLRWQAIADKYPQVVSLPDPMLYYEYFAETVETRVGPQRHKVALSQGFPWPGTLRAAGEVVVKEAEVAGIRYDRAVRDFIIAAKLSYHELIYLRRAKDITSQNADLLRHLVELTTSEYAKGNAKLQDLLKAQSQLAQLSYDLILFQELELVEVAKLNQLLDRPGDTMFGKLQPLATVPRQLNLQTLEAYALVHRQEIQSSRVGEEKAEAQVRLARLQGKPKFSAKITAVETGSSRMANTTDSGKDPVMLGIGLTIPWDRERERARVRAAQARREEARQQTRELENATGAKLREIYFRLENARRLVELYEKTLIPQAERIMELSENWEKKGVKDVAGLLETQTTWLNFNLARIRAHTDWQQYLARLEQLLGAPLPGEAVPKQDQEKEDGQ